MAKWSKKDEEAFYNAHLKHLNKYVSEIQDIYSSAINKAVDISKSIEYNADKVFSFSNSPRTKAEMNKLTEQMHNRIYSTVVSGINAEWGYSNVKNDAMVMACFGGLKGFTKNRFARYFDRNNKALEVFTQRKTDGLNLSDRVWKYTNQFKEDIELGIDLGLGEGKSGAELARELKKYLNEPDRLYRRVKEIIEDEKENTYKKEKLLESKAMQAYHPGQGVYRSSYKNARRLAVNEINTAYRTADSKRWQELPTVVGIKISLSNNHTLNGEPFYDMCDELIGDYPKDFIFKGWHVLCRCFATSILMTTDEIIKVGKAILRGEDPNKIKSANRVTKTPENFNEWIRKNGERIENAKSKPSFILDNGKYIKAVPKQQAIDSISIKDFVLKMNTESNKDIKDFFIKYSKEYPEQFNGVLADVRFSSDPQQGFMSIQRKYINQIYDVKGGNILSITDYDFKIRGSVYNPLSELKLALSSIQSGSKLSFNQEYTLESIQHEFQHAGAVGWGLLKYKTTTKSVVMETINQFTARHNYDKFITNIGGKASHKKEIIEKGYGYEYFIDNFRYTLKQYNISDKTAADYFNSIIETERYENIYFKLIEFLEKNNVNNAVIIARSLDVKKEKFEKLF